MLQRFGIFITLGLCSILVYAKEGAGTDSFKTATYSVNMDDSVDFLLRFASELVETNPARSYAYAVKARELCSQFKIEEKNAAAFKYMGEAKIELEDYFQAKKYLQDALQYYNTSKSEADIADIQYSLGITCYYLAQYQEAMINYRLALKIYNKLGKKQDAANILQNIGLIHHELDDIDKAALYYKEALEINRELKNDTNVAGLYQNLGLIYYRDNEFENAAGYYNKSIDIFKSLGDTQGIATTFSNIGLIHLEQNSYEEAFKSFEQSKKYFEKVDYKLGTMWVLYNMGVTRMKQKDYPNSSRYLTQSLEIAKGLKSPEGVMSNYKALSDLNLATSNYKLALNCFVGYTTIKDSIHSVESKQKIDELETLYKLESQEKQLAESVAELKRLKTQKFAILVVFFILLGASIVIYFAYRQKKAAEAKLASHKLDLENIILEKTKELKNQITERKIAEESDKLKTAFLANMSHELRTPMNAIIAFSNFLRQPKLSAKNRDEYLDHITSAGESLLRLVDDIIDIAKIETKQIKISISPANVSRLLRDLFKVFFELKIKNNCFIDFYLTCAKDYDYIINTDVHRLRQILSNLLENAFKYTQKGEVEFGVTQIEEGLEFFVRDTGIGIPKDKQSKVFERFSQLENALDRKFGGTGLGLTISKNLIELLGGKIWIDSEPGLGSTFYVIIPAVEVRKVPVAKESSIYSSILKTRDYNWESKTILIAEDEELNYKVLDSCLSKTRVKVLRANNGEKAVEMCKSEKIDLVLMDIQMPVMDGYKATYEIKKIKNHVPVIAQTSFTMANEREKCLDAGCDDYITKPLDMDILLSMINKFI
jgi:signal transduction histidine kinase/CheY-like chemotaxis protein/Tfp pilus assembly protein PilF